MPIKKPKSAPLPKPFADLTASEDDSTRMRAIRMKRELETAGGFSWNREAERRQSLFSPKRLPFLLAAIGMGALIVFGFIVAGNTGFKAIPQIIYAESWRSDRTAADALADRDAEAERAAALREQAHAEAVRQQALERERAAARGASPR